MIILYNTTDDVYVSSQVIGYIAGVLVVSYNVPQLIRMIRTKSTDDVELVSLLFQITLNLVYITYGGLMQELPILISESFAFLICGSMIILKRLYDKKKGADANEETDLPEETKIKDRTSFCLAKLAIFFGSSNSTLWYSDFLGEFFFVVPIQKKQSSPFISGSNISKLSNFVSINSILEFCMLGFLRTNNLIF